MAQLAIERHKQRGSEVIALLEMLGGVNAHNLYGDENYAYYTIDGDNEIKGGTYIFGDEYLLTFTLEKFFEKFPYKVGDKVKVCGDNLGVIIGMRWEIDYVVYKVKLSKNGYETSKTSKNLQPYKEQETIDKTKFPYEIGTRVSVKSRYIKKLATIVGLSYNSCACMQYEIKFDGEDVVIHYPTDLMIPITTEEKGTKVENREIMNAKEFLSNKWNDVVKQENRLHSITHGDTLLLLKSNMESYYKILYKKEVLNNILNNTDDDDMEDVKNHLKAMIKAFREDLDNRPFMGQTNSLSINITILWENETKRELIKLFERALTLM